MCCKLMGNKIVQWFNENRESNSARFPYSFRGKESFALLKFFPSLLVMLSESPGGDSDIMMLRLTQLFYQLIQLRKLVSLSVRIENIPDDYVTSLKEVGRRLFKSSNLYETSISPSLWVFSNVAPCHAEEIWKSTGYGLGLNTMEGREQKHQQIKRYSTKTLFQRRWVSIIRHEFIQLIYLRRHGFDIPRYRKRDTSYLPKVLQNCCSCSLQLVDGLCKFCDNNFMQDIKVCVEDN